MILFLLKDFTNLRTLNLIYFVGSSTTNSCPESSLRCRTKFDLLTMAAINSSELDSSTEMFWPQQIILNFLQQIKPQARPRTRAGN